MKRTSFLALVSALVPAVAPGVARAAQPKTTLLPGGLKAIDLRIGKGAVAKSGDNVRVHYVGTLLDGTKFDSSRDRNEPFDFPLGGGHVIAGWDEGVAGMRVGGLRKLIVPPDLAYGAQGAGDKIPPNATLIFTIELLAITPG
jgi:FKBP-type peptidyl-prolyl cis-trans isomerase